MNAATAQYLALVGMVEKIQNAPPIKTAQEIEQETFEEHYRDRFGTFALAQYRRDRRLSEESPECEFGYDGAAYDPKTRRP